MKTLANTIAAELCITEPHEVAALEMDLNDAMLNNEPPSNVIGIWAEIKHGQKGSK